MLRRTPVGRHPCCYVAAGCLQVWPGSEPIQNRPGLSETCSRALPTRHPLQRLHLRHPAASAPADGGRCRAASAGTRCPDGRRARRDDRGCVGPTAWQATGPGASTGISVRRATVRCRVVYAIADASGMRCEPAALDTLTTGGRNPGSDANRRAMAGRYSLAAYHFLHNDNHSDLRLPRSDQMQGTTGCLRGNSYRLRRRRRPCSGEGDAGQTPPPRWTSS